MGIWEKEESREDICIYFFQKQISSLIDIVASKWRPSWWSVVVSLNFIKSGQIFIKIS